MDFGAEALRRSLGHFALGKVVTGVSAVVLLVVLARVLPKADYALYATLQGLVLVIGAVASFGINQAVLRFLPEMRALGHNRAMYALLWRGIATRCVAIALGFGVCAFALPWIGATLGLQAYQPWVLAYFAVGTVRLVGFFVATAMESLLWPRVSQYALALASLLKLGATLALAVSGSLDFPTLVVVEAVSESLALLGLVTGLRRNQRTDPRRDSGDPDWARRQIGRLRAFGRQNYISNLVSQLSTTAPYRVLAAATLSVENTALMGLVFGLTDLVRRFLPAEMGRFVLRSVLVADASNGTGNEVVTRRLGLNFRANAVLLTLLSSSALAGGSGALATFTAGKYPGVGPLLAAMGVVLLLNLWRMQYDMLASVVERMWWSIRANLGLAVGPAVAWLAAAPAQGWAVVAGAGAGQLAAITIYRAGSKVGGEAQLADMRSLLYFGLNFILAAGTHWALPSASWMARLLVAITGFVFLTAWLKPVRLRELAAFGGRGTASGPDRTP